MSDVSKLSYRRQRSIYQVHYCLQKEQEEKVQPYPWKMTDLEVQAYGSQVAGHQSTDGTKYLGLLQLSNGTLLKPILKPLQKREIDFYDKVNHTEDADLIELCTYTPKYTGCKKFTYNSLENEYIILEDLTEKMIEPCIMDVKIGRRTWDPLASEDKIAKEKSKYALSKEEYAFCIPGYQIYKIPSGNLFKYGKEYGKKLHGKAVKDVIKKFLNGTSLGLCRTLIMQFLTELWKIEKWASRQTSVRLYSSSLLLVYDANRLRACCKNDEFTQNYCHVEPVTRRHSVSTHNLETAGSNFSGQLSASGPRYPKLSPVPIMPMTLAQTAFTSPKHNSPSPWSEALDKMVEIHSFKHNYDDNVSKMKVNYRAALDQLSDDRTPQPWATVKIIDFAHAFFNYNEQETVVDTNFKEGIANLVRVFEDLLRES